MTSKFPGKVFLIGKILSALSVWIIFFSLTIRAEKLPLKHFTIAHGLPQNTINFIKQDRQGFFWIGTKGGLSRFDGYEFVNFTQKEGLPGNEVIDFLETREGDFWLTTPGDLVKFNPNGKVYDRVVKSDDLFRVDEIPLFTTYSLSVARVSKLFQDSRGTIWIGTSKGLFEIRRDENQYNFLPFEIGFSENEDKHIYLIYEDKKGVLWIGTESQLVRILPDKRLFKYVIADNDKRIFRTMIEDRNGNFWVGTFKKGLFQFAVDETGTPKLVRQFSDTPDAEADSIEKIIESANGKIWIAGAQGLYEFEPEKNKLFHYTRTSGIGFYRFQTMLEDRNGNLWLGTITNGLYRLSTEGLISYGTEDRVSFVRSVALDNENNLLLTGFVTNTELDEKGAKVLQNFTDKFVKPYNWHFGKLDEKGFSWVMPKFSKAVDNYSWGDGQSSFQAKNGEWWILTGNGLFRFPKVEFKDLANVSPLNVFDEKNGLEFPMVYHLFEDSKENVWISADGNGRGGFYMWERATGTLHDMSRKTNYADLKFPLINCFAEDADGNIWTGFRDRGFARLKNGRLEFFGDEQKVPPGGVAGMFVDREKRLWIALRQNGILQIENPLADDLSFVNYTKDDGLSSNRTYTITQDRQGFIYIGTDSDINRFNPNTKEFKYFYPADDEPQREFRSSICDQNGTLWFGTTEGLTKYVPAPDKPLDAPEVLITGVVVGNTPQKVSAIGSKELNLPTLSPEQNQIDIHFVTLSNFETGTKEITYQYKINDGEWSDPSKENFVNFANLSSGNYQISFRAIFSNQIFNQKKISENPAVVNFRISPPIYLRWWFIGLGMLLVSAIIYAFYRLRLQKLLEVERTRTLIATDLHDDIGSNLSKISVLSEVVRMQLEQQGKSDNQLLSSIADISRSSVSSMSDIVWAINPQRDTVREMIRKMREHAEEILVPKDVEVRFKEPDKSAKIKLAMDLRRDLYLIFKEAINNTAKHADCTQVKIDFEIRHHEIILQIEDNGSGFDLTAETSGGNGLTNMKKRAERLKGNLQIESEPDRGTKIIVRFPQN